MSAVRLFRTYVDTGNGQIPGNGQVHCRVAMPADRKPERPPLLCLHMSPKSGWIYEPLLARLGSDRIVVAPDTPGFGMSDLPAQPPDIADYAATLAEVAVNFEPHAAWDLLGYHTGAQIAVEMARSPALLVRRLLLISVPVLGQDERAAYHAVGLGQPHIWDEAGEGLLALWKLVLRWRTPGGDPAHSIRSLADTLIAGNTGWWGHAAAFRHDMQRSLLKVTQPIAILNPGDDLFEVTRRARALCPDAEYVEMPHWAHLFMQQFPDEAATVIAALLAVG